MPASGSARADAETSPLQNPQYYQFDIDLAAGGRGLASWQRHRLLAARPDGRRAEGRSALTQFGGRVSDSGEGRWTLKAAIDTGVPAPVLSSALFDRFSSQGESEFADKLLSAMRYAFGGHVEKPKTARERARAGGTRLMTSERSDALVLFGATGDLAHKKIFPALYAMVAKGTLTEPVIGVALRRLGCCEQLQARAR